MADSNISTFQFLSTAIDILNFKSQNVHIISTFLTNSNHSNFKMFQLKIINLRGQHWSTNGDKICFLTGHERNEPLAGFIGGSRGSDAVNPLVFGIFVHHKLLHKAVDHCRPVIAWYGSGCHAQVIRPHIISLLCPTFSIQWMIIRT